MVDTTYIVTVTPVKIVEYVHQDWKIAFDALVGVGTILLAVVTVFGENLKKFVLTTKLKIDIDNNPPFIEERKIKNDDGSFVEKVTVIRLCVSNGKKITAINCMSIIHEYYSLIKNQTNYKTHKISPGKLKWDNTSEVVAINNEFPAYLEIAKICKPHVETFETETFPEANAAQQNNNKLFLLLKDRSEGEEDKNLGEGNFILPIRILSDNIKKSEMAYINITFVIDENGSDKLTVKIIERTNFVIEK